MVHQKLRHGATRKDNGLGDIYSEGYGIPKNSAEAEMWYVKAAEQGDVVAQCSLGYMYVNGDGGVAKNDRDAAKWFIKAAEQGDVGAQYHCANMYAEGLGIPQNFVLAYSWANIAAAADREAARDLRDNLAKLMTPDQIAEGQRLSAAYKPKKAHESSSKSEPRSP